MRGLGEGGGATVKSVPMTWRALLRDAHFRRGAGDMLAFGPGLAAWGVVTGVAMVQSGLGVWLSVLMSLIVYRGQRAARLAAADRQRRADVGDLGLGLLRQPALRDLQRAVARATSATCRAGAGCCSAICSPTSTWSSSRRRGRAARHETGQARYAAGGAVAVWLLWQATSIAGILLSSLVPLEWGLGFAGTLSMLGIAYALAGRPHRLGRGHRRRGGGGRGVLAAAEAQHPGRHRRGRERRPLMARAGRAARALERADDASPHA